MRRSPAPVPKPEPERFVQVSLDRDKLAAVTSEGRVFILREALGRWDEQPPVPERNDQ